MWPRCARRLRRWAECSAGGRRSVEAGLPCRPATVAGAAAPEAQRAAFRQAYATASQGGDAWRAQAQGLQDYVLYPYLEAASLEHDIAQLDSARVKAIMAPFDVT